MKDLYPGLRVSQAEKEDIFETGMTNTEWMRYRITGGQLPDRYAPSQERRWREQTRNRYQRFEPRISVPTPIHEIVDFETYLERSSDAMRQIGGKLQDSEKRPDMQAVSSQMRSIGIASLQHYAQTDRDPRGARIREQAQALADLTVKHLQDPLLTPEEKAHIIKVLYSAQIVSQAKGSTRQFDEAMKQMVVEGDSKAVALLLGDPDELLLGANMFYYVRTTKGFLDKIDEDTSTNHYLILADGLTRLISNRMKRDGVEEVLSDERQWLRVLMENAKYGVQTDSEKEQYQEVADRYASIISKSEGYISHRTALDLLNTVVAIYSPTDVLKLRPPDILPFLRTIYIRKINTLNMDGFEKLIIAQLKDMCQMFQIDFGKVTGEED